MSDAVDGLREGFSERLTALVDRHKDLILQMGFDEARELGARGADAAIAPAVWGAAVGDRWPTTTTTEFLHVTRQALHKRVVNGSVIGLPGRGTTWFPEWQFDLNGHEVRSVVADIVKAFRDEIGSTDPFVISAWATTDQPELGMSPQEWLEAGKDPTELVRIACRAPSDLGR